MVIYTTVWPTWADTSVVFGESGEIPKIYEHFLRDLGISSVSHIGFVGSGRDDMAGSVKEVGTDQSLKRACGGRELWANTDESIANWRHSCRNLNCRHLNKKMAKMEGNMALSN